MGTDFSKRLLKRYDNNTVDFADKIVCADKKEYREELDRLDDMVYQKLCYLEDKIEDGTLIELPYKLGTELHFIVLNMHSGELEIFTTEFWAYVSRYKDEFGGVEFAIEIIDVDFDNDSLIEVCNFLTKAEAEAKLKELKE